MTKHTIVDSDSGDELGTIDFSDEEGDDMIIETLQRAGYLDAGDYQIERNRLLSEPGELAVVDEFGEPRLCLEVDPDDLEDDEDDEDEGDDFDDDDDPEDDEEDDDDE